MKDHKPSVNLKVKIQLVKINVQELLAYANLHRQGKSPAKTTLNDYIHHIKKLGKDVIAIADLSELHIGSDNEPMLDLSHADLSGCKMSNTEFINCNMSNVIARDTDLSQTVFDNTVIRDMDMRGADLTNCFFSESYRTALSNSNPMGGLSRDDIKGVKFSVSEKKALRHFSYSASDEILWQKRDQELAKPQTSRDKSFKLLPEGAFTINGKILVEDGAYLIAIKALFDPCYVSGRSNEENETIPLYVNITRHDLKRYSFKTEEEAKLKKPASPLSLNEFITSSKAEEINSLKQDLRQKLCKNLENAELSYARKKDTSCSEEKLNHLKQDIESCQRQLKIFDQDKFRIIAFGENLDLRELELVSANLSGSYFKNCAFKGSKMVRSKIDHACFEQCDMSNSSFEDVSAVDSKFLASNLQESEINSTNFKRAFLYKSNVIHSKILDSNFDLACLRRAMINYSKIHRSSMQYSDMREVTACYAEFQQVKAQHAIIENAILNYSTILESVFDNAVMDKVSAIGVKIQKTSLQNLKAHGINLSKAEISLLCTLDGASLQHAILNKAKIIDSSMKKANLDYAKSCLTEIINSELQEVKARFSSFEQLILKEVKAQNINLSDSLISNMKAYKVNFEQAILRRINGDNIEITESNMQKADLQDSNITKMIMKQVNIAKAKMQGAKIRDSRIESSTFKDVEVDLATSFIGMTWAGNIDPSTVTIVAKDAKEQTLPLKKFISEAEQVGQWQNRYLHNKQAQISLTITGKLLSGLGGFFQWTANKIKNYCILNPDTLGGALALGGLAWLLCAHIQIQLQPALIIIIGAATIGGYCIPKFLPGCGNFIPAFLFSFYSSSFALATGLFYNCFDTMVVEKVTGNTSMQCISSAVNFIGKSFESISNFVDKYIMPSWVKDRITETEQIKTQREINQQSEKITEAENVANEEKSSKLNAKTTIATHYVLKNHDAHAEQAENRKLIKQGKPQSNTVTSMLWSFVELISKSATRSSSRAAG